LDLQFTSAEAIAEMNKTIAIIGAGPDMGLAIAKIFGAQGFNVALLSSSPAPLKLHTKRDEVEKVFMLEGGVR
jgi:NAD(P)-dependent dehydrogenase (short-subunit alcohol dehydrogenase family)